MMRDRDPQAGNVIVIILIGIVLFAALSYTVTKSTRVGGDLGSKEKLDIKTTEILTYANSVNTAVKGLMVNGCSETQISFENPSIGGYANAGAPADKSCNIFDIAGGGQKYTDANRQLLNSKLSSFPHYGQWIFSSSYCLRNVGTYSASCVSSEQDLVMYLPYITYEECNKITASIPAGYYNSSQISYFTGAYPGGTALSSNSFGSLFGCFGTVVSGTGRYTFYQVLIAR